MSTSVQHIMPKYEQLLEVTCLIDSQIIMQNGTVCLLQIFFIRTIKKLFYNKKIIPTINSTRSYKPILALQLSAGRFGSVETKLSLITK